MPSNPEQDKPGLVEVRGAREHNLRNVDVDIPRDRLVVFTGVSGSGKSSLAFGTIYAEAQRRYLDSVAPYARRLLDQAGTPQVDRIDGLPPAVALQQQRGAPTARSSVGSVTHLADLVRLLYSRAGSYPPGQAMLFAEDFSPNTPQGACPHCHGLGRVYDATEKTMVPDDRLTIRERAIAAWPPAWYGQNLRDILVSLGHDVDKPWHRLPKKTRDWILFTDEQPVVPVYAGFSPEETADAIRRQLAPSYMGTFSSARRYLLHNFATTQSASTKKRVARFLVGTPCPACAGKRLKPEALAVRFAGLDIGELARLPLAELAERLRPAAEDETGDATPGRATARAARTPARHAGARHEGTPDVTRTSALSIEKRIAAQRIAIELRERIGRLTRLGLGYLGMERATTTLSSGELQRLRLATQLASQLFGVVYVLDEPSAGLHPADGEALLDALEGLRDAGNSVFVVEHDTATMRRAQWLVDVGPGAGEGGGQVLYSGPPEGLQAVAGSQTARYLFPAQGAAAERTPRTPAGWLRLRGISRHNLMEVDADVPLGCLCAVTGVSGSGKSSLVSQALVELVSDRLGAARQDRPDERTDEPDSPGDEPAEDMVDMAAAATGRIAEGMEGIQRLVQVDQKPIGRTPRSNLATYTGLFDAVRKLFAATPEARERGYGAGRFSFNVPQGRCPVCEGEGFVSVEMMFMPSVYAPCPQCHGARYAPETLEVTWQDRNIAEVLGMTVDGAAAFFAAEPAIARPLEVLQQIGLGYLRLGQPATELSGGEAQRIKLATELQRLRRGDTLYVLDEPTTGLHPADVDRLLLHLHALADAGNTVVVVEHDMRLVAQSDWVIDIGPGAGLQGGQVVASGTPREVAGAGKGRTAAYLAEALGQG
ncbi:ATP-binding cassette domain-containing protein [Xylophilus rhododendri]|uniref:UvrABC system protein A n=1 Tax=Xylophilus rhododendri TaxID=2697032 RepID=A0A857IZV9_9BURK|nr:excinuclease ABC subunit UvrA [Xylophilus rhododendri]QHI97144.1 ATP-binding cassette domain-containing protein [Xylophilus rhododendri]